MSGHVGYCASRCTPAERTVMRWLYPRIARLFARQTAEIGLVDGDELPRDSTDPSTSKNSPPDSTTSLIRRPSLTTRLDARIRRYSPPPGGA